MWKYVGHRFKDSAELTCTHLKNLRSTFSTSQAKPTKDAPKQERLRFHENWNNARAFNLWECFDTGNKRVKPKPEPNVIEKAYFIKNYNPKQKQKRHDDFHKCCDLSFLQWVSIRIHLSFGIHLLTINWFLFRRLGFCAAFILGNGCASTHAIVKMSSDGIIWNSFYRIVHYSRHFDSSVSHNINAAMCRQMISIIGMMLIKYVKCEFFCHWCRSPTTI